MRIAYVGPYLTAATESAALQRAMGISRSLTSAGAEVLVGAGDAGAPHVRTVAPSITAVSLRELDGQRPSSLRKGVRRARWGERTAAWLDSIRPPLDAVIIYGGGALFAQRVMSWSRRARVATILDCVEWYDPSHQPLGRFGPISMDFEIGMRRVYRRADFVICVSTTLERHFKAQGCRTIVVPPTRDVSGTPWRDTTTEGPLTFAYAGTPGRKDLLANIIRGIHVADPTGTLCRLDAVGVTREQLVRHTAGFGDVPAFVRAHGHVSQDQALDVVSRAHYSPLLRPDVRYANAGFPTKVVDSLSVGTPVMCNLTSDLRQHVMHRHTGIVSRSESATDFAVAVATALAIPPHEYSRLRVAARSQAEKSFDFRVHTSRLARFLEQAARSTVSGADVRRD